MLIHYLILIFHILMNVNKAVVLTVLWNDEPWRLGSLDVIVVGCFVVCMKSSWKRAFTISRVAVDQLWFPQLVVG